MTDFFLDSSALVKRYADEPGSDWIRQITSQSNNHTILIAEITLVEVAAALAAKYRTPNGLTSKQRDKALGRFLQDCTEQFVLLNIDRNTLDRAVELTQNHRLRGYDAIQLSVALSARDVLQSKNIASPTFVASDADLLTAAKNELLPVQDPLASPA